MYTRFVKSLIAGIAGVFLVVASQAFTSTTVAWLAFAIGIGVLVLAGVPALAHERGRVSLGLDGVTGLLAAWTIVASSVFAGTAVTWLSFAEGAAFAALALGDLVLDQVRLTRQVRSLAPTQSLATVPAKTAHSSEALAA